MATLNIELLEAALADGLIPKRLSANQKLYLHPTVLSADAIYWAIASEDGLDFEQLENRTGLAKNTLKQFTRWMIGHKLLYAEEEGKGGRYTLFTKQKRTAAKRK